LGQGEERPVRQAVPVQKEESLGGIAHAAGHRWDCRRALRRPLRRSPLAPRHRTRLGRIRLAQ
jgi:hypothetical protein